MDPYDVIIRPKISEAIFTEIEMLNRLVFICRKDANKHQIKSAVEELFNVTVAKINTSITPLGKKKAYVTLTDDHDAGDLASRLGLF